MRGRVTKSRRETIGAVVVVCFTDEKIVGLQVTTETRTELSERRAKRARQLTLRFMDRGSPHAQHPVRKIILTVDYSSHCLGVQVLNNQLVFRTRNDPIPFVLGDRIIMLRMQLMAQNSRPIRCRHHQMGRMRLLKRVDEKLATKKLEMVINWHDLGLNV